MFTCVRFDGKKAKANSVKPQKCGRQRDESPNLMHVLIKEIQKKRTIKILMTTN